MILKVQRPSTSFKSWFGALEYTGGSWLGLGILILIWIWPLIFDTSIFPGLALSWFWESKEHQCHLNLHLGLLGMLEVPDWGWASWFWLGYGHWSFIQPWSEFWLSLLILRCKEQPCSLSHYLGLWRILEVPDWGLASWSWFGYGHWSLIHQCSEFWLSILIWRWKDHSCYLSPHLEDSGGSWLGFGIYILICIWSLVFDTIMIQILAPYLDFEGGNKLPCP